MTALKIFLAFMLFLAVVLLFAGCGPNQEAIWQADQKERCRVMHGQGSYVNATNTFVCFGPAKPFSFKLEFNKDVEYKAPTAVRLFEERYVPK